MHICKRMSCFSPVFQRASHSQKQSRNSNKIFSIKEFPNTINRENDSYPVKYYRAHWQPLWAIIGLTSCTSMVITLGWSAVYDLCAGTAGVTTHDSIVDLINAYLGVSGFNWNAVPRTDSHAVNSLSCSPWFMLLTRLHTRQGSFPMEILRTYGTRLTYLMRRRR